LGKFIPEILPPTFSNRCKCGHPFKSKGFVCVNGQPLCIDCGRTSINL
jgi:formylmethanofuran dehydrogenase subunit E